MRFNIALGLVGLLSLSADAAKIWMDYKLPKPLGDVYGIMQENIKEAIEGFQAVIDGKSEVERLGEILREMIDVSDGNNDKLETVKGTLGKIGELLAAGPSQAKDSYKWQKEATRDDITIWGRYDHLAEHPKDSSRWADVAVGQAIGADADRVKMSKPDNTVLALAQTVHNANKNPMKGFENAPEYIQFNAVWLKMLADREGGFQKDETWARVEAAVDLEKMIREILPDVTIDAMELRPMDLLLSPEHVLIHELCHTRAIGRLTHPEAYSGGWKNSVRSDQSDKETNPEVIAYMVDAVKTFNKGYDISVAAGSIKKRN